MDVVRWVRTLGAAALGVYFLAQGKWEFAIATFCITGIVWSTRRRVANVPPAAVRPSPAAPAAPGTAAAPAVAEPEDGGERLSGARIPAVIALAAGVVRMAVVRSHDPAPLLGPVVAVLAVTWLLLVPHRRLGRWFRYAGRLLGIR